mmetsp:Transcript_3788/g.10756  ORF Transcript_3788/g.10756 Transcript_3788/m.10756 type:complete len:273 (+) Transcript_3788:714-1532(+)
MLEAAVREDAVPRALLGRTPVGRRRRDLDAPDFPQLHRAPGAEDNILIAAEHPDTFRELGLQQLRLAAPRPRDCEAEERGDRRRRNYCGDARLILGGAQRLSEAQLGALDTVALVRWVGGEPELLPAQQVAAFWPVMHRGQLGAGVRQAHDTGGELACFLIPNWKLADVCALAILDLLVHGTALLQESLACQRDLHEAALVGELQPAALPPAFDDGAPRQRVQNLGRHVLLGPDVHVLPENDQPFRVARAWLESCVILLEMALGSAVLVVQL